MSPPFHEQPHDRLVKVAFGSLAGARPLLDLALPEDVRAALDLSTLALAGTSVVGPELRERIADLLFTVRSRGGPVFLHVLIEHKSEPERFTIFHLLGSCLGIWSDARRRDPKARHLPRVLPILFHHGEQGWTEPTMLAALFDGNPEHSAALARFDPVLPIVLFDLAHSEDASFDPVAAVNALAGAALWLLKWSRAVDFGARLLRHAELLNRVFPAPGGDENLKLLLHYVWSAGRGSIDPRGYMDELRPHLSRGAENVMRTIGDAFIELGIEKGIEKGIEQGRSAGELEGLRCSIQRILAARFGPPPLALAEKLARIDHHGQLEHLVDRAVTAASQDEFLRALPA